MNKIDLLILAGAGAMIAAAGGLWFSKDQFITLRPMQPDARISTFQPVDPEEHEAQRRRTAVVVPRGSDDPITVAYLKAAKRLRNSPCSEEAKSDYLAAMTAFARNNLQNNLRKARSGEDDSDERFSPLEHQASEYFDRMMMDGFVTQADYRRAMKEVTPAIGLSMAVSEARGEVVSTPFGNGGACDRRRRGEPNPPMSWEPQPGEDRDSGRLDGVRRRN